MGMTKERQIGSVLAGWLFVLGLASGPGIATAQSALPGKGAGLDPELKTEVHTVFVVSATQTASEASAVRTIDDPQTGHRWLLMKDPEHQGGPGRLVLSTESPTGMTASGPVSDGRSSLPTIGPSAKVGQAPQATPQPQIRAGDHLLVEEHSAVADVQLTAIALGPAMTGSVLNARLEIGGRVVRVVADGPGRASFASGREIHP